MTGFNAFPRACERARMSASLQLDGELSELERALLDAHVARCESCAIFIREVGAATRGLRAAELERPARTIALPSRRRPLRPIHVTAAAAVLALSVSLGALVSSFGSTGSRAVPVQTRAEIDSLAAEDVLIREIELARIERERASKRRPQRGLGLPV